MYLGRTKKWHRVLFYRSQRLRYNDSNPLDEKEWNASSFLFYVFLTNRRERERNVNDQLLEFALWISVHFRTISLASIGTEPIVRNGWSSSSRKWWQKWWHKNDEISLSPSSGLSWNDTVERLVALEEIFTWKWYSPKHARLPRKCLIHTNGGTSIMKLPGKVFQKQNRT